ncbi:MAG: TetR/AcrR family transcriptional regulator [Pseudomonadota bacterium]
MPRPGTNTKEALLAAGRVLYPERGAAGLSLRALTEHAGVNLGMFHYHFRTKDVFLRELLQQFYEEMFGQLSGLAHQAGPPLARLRGALLFIACFARDHAAVLGRVLGDASNGDAVAREFLQANAPRHLRLLMALMDEAERAGEIAPLPPLQRFVFTMSSVVLPALVVPRIAALDIAPAGIRKHIKPQVTSDAAIAQRVELALAALRQGAG